MGRVSRSVDAVTVDAYGTMLRLADDPVGALVDALARHGVERSDESVRAAFATEADYYRQHVHEGGDEAGLRELRTRCAGVFLAALGVELDAETFAPAYVGALRFEVIEGTREALEQLHADGVATAVVGNWDISLRERLEELDLARFFTVVVTTARKPSPAGLLTALEALGVEPSRALHVGDEPVDEEAARAAGMRFAPAPLARAVAGLS